MNRSNGNARPKTPGKSTTKSTQQQRKGQQSNARVSKQFGQKTQPDRPLSSSYGTVHENKQPRISRTSYGSCRIQHEELIGSITGTVAFTCSPLYSLNPGIISTYPWLGTQAQGWEQYWYHDVKIKYLTRTGSTTPGSFYMAVDYDAADTAPGGEQSISTYTSVKETAPYREVTLTLRPEYLKAKKFVRTGFLGPNLDVKTYDIGNLILATVDGTTVPWGKVWISYDVEFFQPQAIIPSVQTMTLSAALNSTYTPTTTAQFGIFPFSNIVPPSNVNVAVNQSGGMSWSWNGAGVTSVFIPTGAEVELSFMENPQISTGGTITALSLNVTGVGVLSLITGGNFAGGSGTSFSVATYKCTSGGIVNFQWLETLGGTASNILSSAIQTITVYPVALLA